jgi:hypothetical protein
MRIALAFFGALLMVGGIAAQIEAGQHHPGYSSGAVIPGTGVQTGFGVGVTGWSPNTYSLVRIGGWALLIFGALIVAFALIREFRKTA